MSDKANMRCQICGAEPKPGIPLYRISPKGQWGEWCCSVHVDAAQDRSLFQIVEQIDAKLNPRTAQ